MVRFGEAVAWLFFVVALLVTWPLALAEALNKKKR